IYTDLTKGWSNASKKRGANAFTLALSPEGTEARLQAELAVIGDIQKARINAATAGELTLKAIDDEANRRKVSARVIIEERISHIDLMAEDARNKVHLSSASSLAKRLTDSFTTLEQKKTAIAVKEALDRRKRVADIEAPAGRTGEAAVGLMGRIGPAIEIQAQVDLARQTEQRVSAALEAEILNRRMGILKRFYNEAATLQRLNNEVQISAANKITADLEKITTQAARRYVAEELRKVALVRAGDKTGQVAWEEILKAKTQLYDIETAKINTLAEAAARERITFLSVEQRETIANLKATESAYEQHYNDLVSLAKAAALEIHADVVDPTATAAAAKAEGLALGVEERASESKQVMEARKRLAMLGIDIKQVTDAKLLDLDRQYWATKND
ncbi:hypothetical protein LCGC14_2402600, partial [marine sediment metagenome]